MFIVGREFNGDVLYMKDVTGCVVWTRGWAKAKIFKDKVTADLAAKNSHGFVTDLFSEQAKHE